jgi:hypothetical protein
MDRVQAHDEWCDGYAFAHIGEVHAIGRVMFQARCRECAWAGATYGKTARNVAEREANGHIEEVPCTGQCAT